LSIGDEAAHLGRKVVEADGERLRAEEIGARAAVWAFWVDPEASVVEEKYKLPTAASVAAG